MPAYLNLDLLENPYGKRVGGGYDTVRVGPGGGRLHIKAPDGGALCMQGRKQTDLRASTGRVVDCYRCIKIMGMESNAPYVRRELTTAKGEKKSHYMLPGGRQGQLVADKKASPGGMDGVPTFKRGPKNHPTQPWMTKRIAMAKSYAERLSDEGVALPPYFLPQTFEEMEIAQESSFYESPGAIAAVAAAGRRVSREAAAARRAGRAAAAKQVANPYGGRRNPSDEVRYTRSGMAYIIGADGKPRFVARSQEEKELSRARQLTPKKHLKKTGREADSAKAMRLFHSGQSSSLKTAWDAVKIFGSHGASSLEEAVQMAEGTRRANGRRSR